VRGTLKTAFFVLATLYFTVDAVFLRATIPLSRWIARKRAFIRMRKWIGSLGPYPSLALFAAPVIVLEPVKPVAAYLVATGNFSAGMALLTIGEILKLVLIERLFKLCRYKLLEIPVFAWSYGFWRQGVEWVRSMEAWQTARRWALKLNLRDQLDPKRSTTYRRIIMRLRVTRTRVQRIDR
jgi:hypothetical protein